MTEISDETVLNRRIAAKVKSLRAKAGLSLETLAQASGVSRSMLSLIERAETSATAVVLEKIATALDVSLAALFEAGEASPASPLIRASARVVWTDPESGYQRSNISPPGIDAPFHLVEVTLPVGCRVSFDLEAGRPAFHHQIWILEGSLRLREGDAVYTLEEGDCLAMPIGAGAFVNIGAKPCRYVVALSRQNDARKTDTPKTDG